MYLFHHHPINHISLFFLDQTKLNKLSTVSENFRLLVHCLDFCLDASKGLIFCMLFLFHPVKHLIKLQAFHKAKSCLNLNYSCFIIRHYFLILYFHGFNFDCVLDFHQIHVLLTLPLHIHQHNLHHPQ